MGEAGGFKGGEVAPLNKLDRAGCCTVYWYTQKQTTTACCHDVRLECTYTVALHTESPLKTLGERESLEHFLTGFATTARREKAFNLTDKSISTQRVSPPCACETARCLWPS